MVFYSELFASTSARRNIYNPSNSVPYLVMGGSKQRSGSTGIADYINDTYNELSAFSNPVDMTLSATLNSDGMVEITANVDLTDNIVSDDVQIHYFLTLDDAVGDKNTRFTVVAMSSADFTLRTTGESKVFTQIFQLHPSWDLTDIRVVCAVQDMVDQNPPTNNKPVLQTKMTSLSGELKMFVADTISGYPGLTVNFTNKSVTNPVVSYLWDFTGNGSQTSSLESPTYTYTEPGSFTVKMTLNFASGDPVVITKTGYEIITNTERKLFEV